MPKPPQHPLQNPNMRNTTDVLAPTEANALIPKNFPTIAASTSEYVCCSKLPSKSGSVNFKISGNAGPAVISLEVAIRLCSKIARKDTENPVR